MHIEILAEMSPFLLYPNEPDSNVYVDKHLCISSALVIYFVAL